MKSKRLIELLTKELFPSLIYSDLLMFFQLDQGERKEMESLFIELSKADKITEATKDIIGKWYNIK